jgi:hypothetical protein
LAQAEIDSKLVTKTVSDYSNHRITKEILGRNPQLRADHARQYLWPDVTAD